MYLSKIVLNPHHRDALAGLASPYRMHQLLWRCVAPEGDAPSSRILYRVDSDPRERQFLIVQSDTPPSWDALPTGFAHLPPATKLWQPQFATGQRLRFRLRANPTKRIAPGNPRGGDLLAGRRVGLITTADQLQWILKKGSQGGFSIPGAWQTDGDGNERWPDFRVQIAPEGWDRLSKRNHTKGRFVAVRYDGVLEVTDPERFLSTLQQGIGSAKGFGFGLLSVAPG